ncbi:hypothetical protein EI94DRAFT_1796113 [Lactarius quietus]|nr:hypothetical protein EI94DRAFT_1796113 [Lactarius quietus]
MPTTRSASTAKPSSSRVDATLPEVGELNGGWRHGHLSALQRGIQDLQKTQGDLLERNQRLQREIDRLHNQADVSVQPNPAKSRGKSNALQMTVKELEVKVRRMEKARALDRRKIRQLQSKEAHKDAEELQNDEVHGVPDVEHEMKKCRKECDVESFEVVDFTATQQWDQLLEIARRFAALEDRLGPDTSEEEEEENLRENFIDDDDDVEASSESRDRETTPDTVPEGAQNQDEGEEDSERDVPYSQSGVVEKRRRMERLAARKKRRQ